MIEESPPLAMTAYTARSRWPCDVIRILITPVGGTGLFSIYTNHTIDIPAHLDQLATSLMGNDWERGFLSRWGWLRNSGASVAIDIIRAHPGAARPAGCSLIYDLGEFMHMLDMINMGEFPFTDMDLELGTPPATDSEEEAPLYNFG
jgi:hypothetical protein